MEKEKTYIGKGKQVKDYDMFEVSICLDDAEKHAFEFEGKHYLKFTLSKMQKPDKQGRDFTAYIKELPPQADGKKKKGS